MKKLYVMAAIIVFIVSVGKVEEAYQEMMGVEGFLIPEISRVDTTYIVVSALGEEGYINTARLFESVYTARYHAKGLLDRVSVALGLREQEEPIREAYGLEIL